MAWPGVIMTEFAPFSRLCVELRIAIWELAARSDNKCAHFLTIEQPDSWALFVSSSRDKESAFNRDAGMWTACRESREVCLESYRQLQRGLILDAKTSAFFGLENCIIPGSMMVQGPVQGNPGMVATILPQDLVVLRVRPGDNWPWINISPPIFWDQRLPCGNIAIEYDPSWARDYRYCDRLDSIRLQRTVLGFFARLIETCARRNTTLWLLDRHTRLPADFRAGPDTSYHPLFDGLCEKNYNPKIFHTYGEIKFVEVGAELWWADEVDEEDCSAFTFLSLFGGAFWPRDILVDGPAVKVLLVKQ